MKKLFFVFMLAMLSLSALSALSAGDIAILAVNTDATKSITLVALADIPGSSEISFTDNAWNATTETWRTGEGTIVWTSPATELAKGSIVTITLGSPYSVDYGSVTNNTSFNLSASGDQILVYSGTTEPASNTSGLWIYGFSTESFVWANNSNTSDIPTILAGYSVAMTSSTTETDNAYFANGSDPQTVVSVTGTRAALLDLFTNNANYYMNNTGPLTVPSYTVTVNDDGGTPQVSAPYFSPAPGDFIGSVEVGMACDEATASIYYTTDDTDPTDASTLYTDVIGINQTTTFKAIAYAPGFDPSSVVTGTYTKLEPATTTLPYSETFDTGLGDAYIYNSSGATKEWYWYATGQCAAVNGYNSGDVEDDWLVLPGINLNDYDNEVLSFDTWYRFGEEDADNYLKLFYSTDYSGLGDPISGSWTELSFGKPTAQQEWAPSGYVDLSEIEGDMVYLAFQYMGNPGTYISFNVDNILIEELSSLPPEISNVVQDPATDIFSTSTVSVSADVVDTDGTVSSVTLHYGLATGVYTDQIEMELAKGTYTTAWDIPAQADGATVYYMIEAEDNTFMTAQSAEYSYTVADPIPCPAYMLGGYTQDFTTFVSYETLPLGWQTSNTTYNGDWGIGTSAGLRGNANVLGFQHTSDTGIFTASLTLENATGATIEQLWINYEGMVERAGEGRSPEWTVKLDDVVIPELFYSTFGGVNATRSVLLTGLSIADGARFEISWSSDRGLPSGSSKQIGIGDVIVAPNPVYDYPEGTPVPVNPELIITVLGGNANQTPPGVDFPEWNNEGFVPSFQMSFNLIGAGPWFISFNTTAPWGAYYRGGSWHVFENMGGIIMMVVDPAKDLDIPIVLGDSDPTLPVELSSFTYTINASNLLVLQWISQSETNLSGYRVYRNTQQNLENALMVSPLIEATNSGTTAKYEFVDEENLVQGDYYYWLQSLDLDGTETFHGPINVHYILEGGEAGIPVIPVVTHLKPVYPNPFNPTAFISYFLTEEAAVKVQVYNSRGQIVARWDNAPGTEGVNRVEWNGKDLSGNACGSGIYFVKMYTGGKIYSQKALLVK